MEARKILFASIPAEGQFNPMTGMAMELKNQGHDIRWYASRTFDEKLKKLGIIHYPFKRAVEVNQFNADEIFPQRRKLKSGIPRLKFDLKHFFIYRAPEYIEDIKQIKQTCDFDESDCDAAYTTAKLIKEKLKIP